MCVCGVCVCVCVWCVCVCVCVVCVCVCMCGVCVCGVCVCVCMCVVCVWYKVTGQMTATITNSEMEKKNGHRVLVANFKKTVHWKDLAEDEEY